MSELIEHESAASAVRAVCPGGRGEVRLVDWTDVPDRPIRGTRAGIETGLHIAFLHAGRLAEEPARFMRIARFRPPLESGSVE